MKSFVEFLRKSPTSWHAVQEAAALLKKQGFERLEEEKSWSLKKGGRYFVIHNNGNLISAFCLPKEKPVSCRLMGSHLDSPGLKVRPKPDQDKEGMAMVSVEVYGGPLLSSWLNRDLALSGRILFLNKKGEREIKLVHLSDAPLMIPQLAIHLDRKIDTEGLKLNKQDHLPALATLSPHLKKGEGYVEALLQKASGGRPVLGFELFLVPIESPGFIGSKGEMLASYRLDNLSSFYASLEALLQVKDPHSNAIQMLCAWDHEEIGSRTAEGAESPFIARILERITLAFKMDREAYLQLLPASLCLSLDVAHAWHPNYAERYEPQHKLILGEGVVLKSNAGQRHLSNVQTAGLITHLAQKAKVKIQRAIDRGDHPSGSTIGPAHASVTGMPTIDLGCPLLSMHSVRELIALDDMKSLEKLLVAFLKEKKL